MEPKSLKLNFMMNAILTMSSLIFPLITFPYVSRILLPTGTGIVAFATSVVTYFAMFAQLGIPIYGIRACARVRDDKELLTKTAQEIFIINLVMSFLVYIIFVIVIFKVPRLQDEKLLFAVLSLMILFNAIGMEWLYKALEQYTYITVRSIIFKVIALIAMFFLVHQQSDYVIYGGVSIFASSASGVLNFINVHKYIGIKPVGHYEFKKHLNLIVIFFAMSCATTIYTNLDQVMLGFMTTNADVGYYNAAVKIKTILVSIVTSLGVVLLPRASYFLEHGLQDEFLSITQKAINFVMLLAAPLMLYFILFAHEGILVLSGTTYNPAVLPMQIIMPTLVFIGLTNIMGIQMLIPMGQEKIVLYSEIAGAVVNLVVNFVLIPVLASIGTSIGTLAAEIIVWVIQYIALRKVISTSYKRIRYFFLVLALFLGSATSIWMKLLPINNFLIMLFSAIVFFGVYVLVLTFAKEPLVLTIEGQALKKIGSLLGKRSNNA